MVIRKRPFLQVAAALQELFPHFKQSMALHHVLKNSPPCCWGIIPPCYCKSIPLPTSIFPLSSRTMSGACRDWSKLTQQGVKWLYDLTMVCTTQRETCRNLWIGVKRKWACPTEFESRYLCLILSIRADFCCLPKLTEFFWVKYEGDNEALNLSYWFNWNMGLVHLQAQEGSRSWWAMNPSRNRVWLLQTFIPEYSSGKHANLHVPCPL